MSKSNPARSSIRSTPPNVMASIALRLYLVKEVVFGDDGDFAWERFDERYNADLANNLGNLVSRVTAMAHQYRQGRLVPTGETSARLRDRADEVAAAYRRAMDELEITHAAAHVVSLDRCGEPTHRRYGTVGAREGSLAGGSTDARSSSMPPRPFGLQPCCCRRLCRRRAAKFCVASVPRPIR